MKRCRHTQWLGLDSDGIEISLQSSNRLEYITDQIRDPLNQIPSLFVLLGGPAKEVALREVFNVKKRPSKQSIGEVHLHCDTSTFNQELVLVAEGDSLLQGRAGTIPTNKCHEIAGEVVRSLNNDDEIGLVGRSIYSNLLYPFASVFCLFSDDLGGIECVARYLGSWFANGFSTHNGAQPKIVVVSEKIQPGATSEREAKKSFMKLLREMTKQELPGLDEVVDIVSLFPRGAVSVQASHRFLKERLMNALDLVRYHREEECLSFSMIHFAALFESACKHFASNDREPFDFIKASRRRNPVAPDLSEHLGNFIYQIKSSRDLIDFAAPRIASSLLLDNYPPGSHMFPPKKVFEVLYKTHFHSIGTSHLLELEDSNDYMLRSGFINLVQGHFDKFFQELIRGTSSAAEIHGHNLRRLDSFIYDIHSTDSCFCCMRRRPQFGLPCGDYTCENCVVVFGERSETDPWIFRVCHCFICGLNTPEELEIKVHPPTAGIGVLCIDGGGVRGEIPLQLMKRIHDRIGLSIPFQRYFKVAFGVSSGGLIVLAMFINGWSIDKSTNAFGSLSKLAFKGRKLFGNPLLPRSLRALISYFSDGLYPPENIEDALQQVFGTDRELLDSSYATATGTRVGLPVATVGRKPSLGIFTNYNGVGKRPKEHDHVIRPKEGVRLWEIARCASAAPGFFPPKLIKQIGTYQDAGPLENDPIVSALTETAATFPLARRPGFIVSLGTGDSKVCDDAELPQGIWGNGALPRLFRLAWEKMCDRTTRQAFHGHPRYNRLSVEFNGDEPRLDDIKSIPWLKLKVQGDQTICQTIDQIKQRVIASFFYFELDRIPVRIDGKYEGTGRILCELRPHEKAFQQLFLQLSKVKTQFCLDGKPFATVGDASSFDADGCFEHRVEFTTAEKFKLTMKPARSQPFDIGGSPFSIMNLIEAQGLDAFFGRPDHRKRQACSDLRNQVKRQRL